MRIFFDARTLRPRMTGVGRYSMQLLAALAEGMRSGELGIERLRALVLESSLPYLQGMEAFAKIEWVPTSTDYESHPSGDIWERFSLPNLIESDELFHGSAFRIPGGRQKFKRVVTIHDLGVFKRPQDSSRRFGAYMRWLIRGVAHAADAIIVPTQAVADDLRNQLGISGDRVRVIPEAPSLGLEPDWPCDTRISNDPIPSTAGPCFISIGTLETRKDPWTALAALEELSRHDSEVTASARWIWIGGPGHRKLDFLRDLRESSARERFRCIGPRSSREIAEAMSRATALVYPSLDEGFGLPPLEAMAAGVPVVASDLAPIREVCGEAALYFPAGNARSLAKCLRQLITDQALRVSLIDKGRSRASLFSWQKSAARTVEVYSGMK